MTIIEMMAAKMHEVWEDGADLDRIARAARDAMVESLTPDQCSDLANVDDGDMHLTEVVRGFKSALIAATEVGDEQATS